MATASEAKIVLTAVDNTSRAFAAARQGLSGLGSAADSVKSALAGIGAVAAASYLTSVIGETRRAIDGFKDLSDATGSSVENVSALDRVARATGGTFEQVSGTLVKFNQVLQEADPKKGAGAVLKSLNLDVEELKKLDPAEALRRTAVALNDYADDGEKARAVQVLFGKSVREVAPFLKDLAESGKLVGTVTADSADEVDRFNKQLSLIQANAVDAGRALSIGLITEINSIIERFREGRKEGKSFLDLFFSSDAEMKLRFARATGTVGVDQRKALVGQLKEAESRLRQFEDPSLNGSQAYLEQLAQRQAQVDSLRTRLRAVDDAGNPSNETGAEAARLKRLAAGDAPKPRLAVVESPKGSTAKKDGSPFNGLSYDEQITQSVGRLFDDSDVTKAKIYADTVKKLDELFFSGAIGADLYDSAMKRLNGSTSAGADQTSKFSQEQQRLNELLTDSELDSQRADMALLAKALEEGTIKEDAYIEAVSRRLNLVGGQLKDAKSFAEEFGLSFSSSMEDAIVKGGDFSDVLTGIAEDLARIIVRKTVTEPLGNAVSGFDWGSLISSILPSAQGNAFTGASALSAYSNTVVNSPTVFPFAKGGIGLMGEAGSEAIMPLTRLANGNLGVGVAGGGGQAVTVQLINESGTPLQATRQSQTQGPDGQMLIRVVVEAVGDALANRTGPVARGLEAGYGLRPSAG